MNGNNTRYSSSLLLKKAQTWRVPSSWDPAKKTGAKTFLIVSPLTPRQWPRVNCQRRMSHPVSACPLYFGIGLRVLDRQQNNKHQGEQSLKSKDAQSVSLPPADTKVSSIPSSNCFFSTDLV